MLKFGTKSYPDNLNDIFRNKEMLNALLSFSKKEASLESLQFLLARFDPYILHTRFIEPGSEEEINISGDLRKRMQALAAAAQWTDAEWPQLIRKAKLEIRDMFENDNLHRFWDSPHFKAFHVKNGGNANDSKNGKEADPPEVMSKQMRAARQLGIEDTKALSAYISAFERLGAAKTRAAAVKLLRDARMNMTPTVFNKLLVVEGFATEPQITIPQPVTGPDVSHINLDLPKLRTVCGFTKVAGVEFQDNMRLMIKAHLNGERTKAITLFEKILKKEPNDSKAQTTPFVDMIKLMKTKKVFDIDIDDIM
ncbi:regulator of G-protein signaling domain-containing protein [Rhizobium halophytocola]|uniref:RGS domain-containing protein n=1 Tax=Rhizobium halophytocola TaxID=735519 RepID=A0ABS4E604_9HYPH|nr:regulator of G-protein signaling domain-containing protein [Rhizobium halophytocola]MBP1853381.1 hypothetical protein [Rhizobium halophytocola]